MPQENTKPVESREGQDERLNREQDQETSRVKFNNFIQHINDASVGYVFSKQRREETRKKRQDLRNENPDEAKAGIYKKVGFIIVLLALVAIGVVDYLIIGGTVDYLLGMHRELQEYEYLVHLKILAIIVLIVIEIAIAVGVAQLRRKYKSKFYIALHWFIGIGLALALTFFAGALMYTKIANEAEQSVVSVVEPATDISSAQDEEEEKITPRIPTQKWMLLAAACVICFSIHTFALMKADAVADAAGWAGYMVRDAPLAGREILDQAAVNRLAGKTEANYRRAYDHWETHNAKFPETPLPSAQSQEPPVQLIPIMRLNPVAQRIINNLQNGTVENLDTAQTNQNNAQNDAPPVAGMNFTDNGEENPPPYNQTGDDATNNAYDGDENNGHADFNAAENDANDNTKNGGNNANAAAGNTGTTGNYQTTDDAQVRNSDSEV